MDDDDRALVAQYRAGHRAAFTELVLRYQRPIYNAALWIVKRSEDASDLAQTTFLKAAERIDDYDPSFRFFSWIYRIAVNESLNHVRARSRESPLDDEDALPATASADPSVEYAERQRAAHLRAALMKLSTNDRVVLTLRHFGEHSYAEMAEQLDLDEKTVKSRLFDARLRLRRLLGDL